MFINDESESESHLSCLTLWPHGLYSPWNSLGQNTGVGSLSLLQGIFPTQGSNPGLLPCSQILYQLSHQGRPRILEWIAYLFSSRSSQPRNWTMVSCFAGRFFTSWAIRETQIKYSMVKKYIYIYSMVIILLLRFILSQFNCVGLSHNYERDFLIYIISNICITTNKAAQLFAY